ncbi:MAG: helix-hairpin-helix domain-containing protein [Phycisphaerae bacterium]|nr:helix-hairpin-helix domain-containing protein [Phycisphaerae bacterium]
MTAPAQPPTPARRAALGTAIALLVLHFATGYAGWQSRAGRPVTAAQVQLRIDPNIATAAELELLPRIGPTLAQHIIAYRASVPEQPAFRTAADLDRVARIGPATVDALRPHLTFPAAPPACEGATASR